MKSITEIQFSTLKIWLVPSYVDNYIFFIYHKISNTTIVVDPGDGKIAENFLTKQGLNLTEIWVTHHHPDHIDGVLYLKEKYLCDIRGSIQIKGRIPGVTIPVNGSSFWKIDEWNIRVFDLPGHTLDHIGYGLQDESHSLLFSGDVLFGLGCGRLFEGTYDQMIDSLRIIMNLPPKTQIFCSHEYTENNLDFTLLQDHQNTKIQHRRIKITEKRKNGRPTVPLELGEELETNLFLLALKNHTKEAFVHLREKRNQF